jgi:hypothetical protein
MHLYASNANGGFEMSSLNAGPNNSSWFNSVTGGTGKEKEHPGGGIKA